MYQKKAWWVHLNSFCSVSEMLSRHLKLFSWTLSFPENLFKNSMDFYVENLEKNFDEFIKKKKKFS